MTQTVTAPLIRLADRIDQLLPQTQCRRCGYDDCRGYAEALARGDEAINRCPPGRDDTIARLARLLERPVLPLADDLAPMPVRQTVRIDPAHCIGCTKCILACPVDAIVGAPRFMHQVLADRCTGCELCLPPCPTDCIEVLPLNALWQDSDAHHGRQHYQRRSLRLQTEREREHQRRTVVGSRPGSAAPAATGSGRHLPLTPPASPSAADMTRVENPSSQSDTLQPRPAGIMGQPDPGPHAPAAAAPDEAHPANTDQATHRDPLVALASAGEKARRLAAIRQKLLAGQHPPSDPAPETSPADTAGHLTEQLASRDPLVALASADEKARRLAAIRQKLAATRRA